MVMEQQSYDRMYVIWITKIGGTVPRIVCYWNTSEVKDGKLKLLNEREQGKPVKQCDSTNQVKKTKEEKLKKKLIK